MSLSTKISSKFIILRRFFFLSLYLGAFSIGLWGAYKFCVGPYFRIWSIDISGNKTISGQALHHLSDVYYGQHVWSWDEKKSAEKIEQHPWIHSAKVVWDFPSQVHITVQEEEIQALLALQKLWYINQDGTPFHMAQSHNLDYPIITGIPQDWVVKHPYIVQRIIKESLEVLDAIDEFEYISTRDISEIYFQKDLGFSIILHNGSKIILGFYDPKSRLDRLSEMLSNGLDLTVPKQIVLDAEKVAVVIPITN